MSLPSLPLQPKGSKPRGSRDAIVGRRVPGSRFVLFVVTDEHLPTALKARYPGLQVVNVRNMLSRSNAGFSGPMRTLLGALLLGMANDTIISPFSTLGQVSLAL